jgi:hypothetical protein
MAEALMHVLDPLTDLLPKPVALFIGWRST